MKRPLFLLASFALALSPLSASAMAVGGEEHFIVPTGITINDDLYAGGSTVILNGTVNGDAVIGGGTVVVNGPVKQDLMVGGGNVTVVGDVGDDLRAGAGNITIDGDVKGDALIGGGTVVISKGAVIEHDLVVGAGSLVIEGTVKGTVRLGGGSIVINGTLLGDTQIEADEVRVGSDAHVTQRLSYRASKEAVIDQGADLKGGVAFEQRAMPDMHDQKAAAKGGLVGLVALIALIKLIGMLIAAVMLVSCFKTYSSKLVERSLSKPSHALLTGSGTLILTPIAVVLLLATLIGAPLAGLLAVGYAYLMVMAKIYAGVVFGTWLWRLGSKNKSKDVDWKTALTGTFLLFFVCLIPIIGWIIGALAFVATLGGLYALTEEKIKTMR